MKRQGFLRYAHPQRSVPLHPAHKRVRNAAQEWSLICLYSGEWSLAGRVMNLNFLKADATR